MAIPHPEQFRCDESKKRRIQFGVRVILPKWVRGGRGIRGSDNGSSIVVTPDPSEYSFPEVIPAAFRIPKQVRNVGFRSLGFPISSLFHAPCAEIGRRKDKPKISNNMQVIDNQVNLVVATELESVTSCV